MQTSRGRALRRTPLGTLQTPRDAQRREGSDVTGVMRSGRLPRVTRGGEQPRRRAPVYGSGRVGSGLDGRHFSVDTKPRLDAKRSCEAGRLALRTKAGQRREIDPPKYVLFFP